MSKAELTLARLREVLHYCPETGVFRWIKVRGSAVGREAGMVDGIRGYCSIRIDRCLYLAHRLAWFYIYAEWPAGHLDHKNGTPADNRIVNLREATRSQNMMNKKVKKDNVTGLKGVKKYKKRFQARIMGDHLGTFDTAEAAHAAYFAEAKKRFGEFARAG